MSPPSFGGLFAGSTPSELGASDGRLTPCPDTPNCVNSQAEGKAHVRPLSFSEPVEVAFERLKAILLSTPRTRIVQEGSHYLRAEVRSRLFGFVDDVEFLLDADRKRIHVRSASRLGHSDFGVNRNRVDAIRAMFEH